MNKEKVKKVFGDISKAMSDVLAELEGESPVATPAETTRFKKLSDGWVLDKALGIEWGPTQKKEMDWKDAKATCELLGGRLPTVKELRSLIDYEKHDPAIDKDFFSDTKSSWYWTSTECAWNKSGAAWVVYFGYGNVGYNFKVSASYVRPVRASQQVNTLTI